MNAGELASRLTAEHRALDDRLGRFLSAAWSKDAVAARLAAEEFDHELRRHTREEEELLLPEPSGHRLSPASAESGRDRLVRELRLEHVQLRELSGMVTRRLSESAAPGEVRALASNLARRWDSHTRREERELLSQVENREL